MYECSVTAIWVGSDGVPRSPRTGSSSATASAPAARRSRASGCARGCPASGPIAREREHECDHGHQRRDEQRAEIERAGSRACVTTTYAPAAASAATAPTTSTTTRGSGPIAGIRAVISARDAIERQRAEREHGHEPDDDDAEQQPADALALDVADQPDRELGDAEREHAAEHRRGDAGSPHRDVELALSRSRRNSARHPARPPRRVAGAEHESGASAIGSATAPTARAARGRRRARATTSTIARIDTGDQEQPETGRQA